MDPSEPTPQQPLSPEPGASSLCASAPLLGPRQQQQGSTGSEMDPAEPTAQQPPPPLEPGAGSLSASTPEVRPRQHSSTGGKEHEGSAKVGGRAAGPVMIIRPLVHKDMRVQQQRPMLNPRVDRKDDGSWGEGDAWHATGFAGQRWQHGGWARDGGCRDDWNRDSWAWDWRNGNEWLDRHSRKHGWDDWGKRSSWDGKGEWADRGCRQHGNYRVCCRLGSLECDRGSRCA